MIVSGLPNFNTQYGILILPVQVALARKWPGIEYTFVLAGFLKIMTLGYIATTAPAECVRTSFGESGKFDLVMW